MDKVTCTEILIVEFCASPESEMKEVGNRTEGVEILTITEADDGTQSDTIESVREQMVSHRKKGKLVVLWSSIPCTGGCPFQYICIKKFGQDYMGHLRELYRIQKKLWKGFLRMSEVADFVAIELNGRRDVLIGDGIRLEIFLGNGRRFQDLWTHVQSS